MSSLPSPSSRLCLRIVAAVVIVLATAGTVWYFAGRSIFPDGSPPPTMARIEYADPRLAYEGPYQNIRPDVASVGSARCAECHADIARTYAQHPMGKSVFPVAHQNIGDLPEHGQRLFSAFNAQFRIDRDGERLSSSETLRGAGGEAIYEQNSTIQYTIGSGNKGHSFLTERDGFVVQSPVSWFSQKKIWDLSPGFSPELHAGRPIQQECLYCHANEVVPVKGTVNRFETPLFHNGFAIGCERCHGPGSEHVRFQESHVPSKLPDYTIVNPARLDAPLREAVCQQCHLAGEARIVRLGRTVSDYRPGLPLDSVIRVLVRDHGGEDRKAVNHVEQMYQSQCYMKSDGAFGCTTCHNPHEKPSLEKRSARYQSVCLKCHDCASPREARAKLGAPNDCISCHMPQFAASDIVHAATTDHRIVRTRVQPKGTAPSRISPRPFLFFPNRRPDLLNSQDASEFALGMIELARLGKAAPGDAARDALPLLERAITENPHEYRTWEGKSFALSFAGRKSEAFAAARTALDLMPEDEAGNVRVAALAAESDQKELAISRWRRAAVINPLHAGYRQELALLLAQTGDWPAAKHEAEEAVRLDPARALARAIVAIAEAHAGNRTRAEELFRTVELLNPANLSQLRQWYRSEGGK